MITQRLKVEKDQAGSPTGNIIKDDGSLFTAFGHNYDNPRNQIIEDSWNKELYAGGFKGANHIAKVSSYRQVDAGIINFGGVSVQTYEIALTTDGNHKFAPNDKIVLSNVNSTYEKAQAFDLDGYIPDASTPRITSVSSDNLTIKYTIGWPVGSVPSDIPALNNVTTSVTGLIVAPSTIESDLAILNLNGSNIIRICLQLDKFMMDKDTPNQDQLNKLYEFCDLAAKYDIYVIINGANTWVAGNQPDWLNFSTDDDRWTAQANFWKTVANKIGGHPAVAWYSLINEPVDQPNNIGPIVSYTSNSITAIVSNDDIQFSYSIDDNGIGTVSIDSGFDGKLDSGYALMSGPTGAELVYYASASPSLGSEGSLNITLNGINRTNYGSYNSINNSDLDNCSISFIDKLEDVTGLAIQNINTSNNTALIDLAASANYQSFNIGSTNSYQKKFGFLGNTYAATTLAGSTVNWGGDPLGSSILVGVTNKNNRYSTQISASLGLSEVNSAISGSVLSSTDSFEYGSLKVPFGYGQALNNVNYASGNTFQLNSVNFGTNDFLAYGTPYGYNTGFFTQSLRAVLSRLRSNAVTEFTSADFPSGSTTVSLTNASNGDYQKATSNQTITFSTPLNFVGGTVAIGFMVENNANAQATITVNNKIYNQSLISGTDVRPGYTLPVVKRIPNLPSGANTIKISFNISSGSACLDYWQIESPNPAPIIVHGIAALEAHASTMTAPPSASGTTYTYTTTSNHNLIPGESVVISGITAGTNYSFFNGTFVVASTPTLKTFTVVGSVSNPTATAMTSGSVLPNYDVNAINNWNNDVANLIFTEFFDGTVLYLDVNSSTALNSSAYLTSTNPNISSDYLNPNDLGHAKIATACKTLLSNNQLIINNGISISGTAYTYTTLSPHGLSVNDLIIIKNAEPATSNGLFIITATPTSKSFTVTGVANPANISIVNATYAKVELQPNTTYSISTTTSNSIPTASRVSFTTGSILNETTLYGTSKVDSNNRYLITLSNVENVHSTSLSEACLITNNTHWLRSPSFGSDRHYSPYISIVGGTNSKFDIARQWINQMKSAIHDNDINTPITFGTLYVGTDGSAGSGFGINNTYDLLDILSPHQYLGGLFGNQTIDTNVLVLAACYNLYNKPVFLEEGGVPKGGTYFNGYVTSPRTIVNYILRSKKYLAGSLNNYQAQGVWVTDPYNGNYQVTFDLLKPFMSDAPSNDSGSDISGFDFGQSTPFLQLDSTNIPKRKGRRYLVPSVDKNRIIASAKTINASTDYLPKATYKYLVTAVMNGNELPAYSSAQCSVNVTTSTKYQVQINWEVSSDERANAEIDSYRIYRYSDSNAQYLLIGLTDSSIYSYVDSYYSSSNSSGGYYHGYLFANLAADTTTNSTRLYVNDDSVQNYFLDYGGARIGSPSNQDFAYDQKVYSASGTYNGTNVSGKWYLHITNSNPADRTLSSGANIYPAFSQFTDNKGFSDFSINQYTYNGFFPIPIDPLTPSNFYGAYVDGSYIAQTHLAKSTSPTSPTFSQMSSMYYNATQPLDSKVIFNLNSINIGSNQTINTLKTVTNLKINQSTAFGANSANQSFFTNNTSSQNWTISSPYTVSNIFSDSSGPNNGLYYPTALNESYVAKSNSTPTLTNLYYLKYNFPSTAALASGSTLSEIDIYFYARVDGTQKLKITLYNGSTAVDTLSQYRGNWVGPAGSGSGQSIDRIYITGDIVYYNGSLWQCPSGSTSSNPNVHTPTSTYWNQLSYSTTPSLVSSTSSSTNYAWVKWAIKSNLTGVSPENLSIKMENMTATSGSYSSIAKIYTEVVSTGTEMMQVKLFRSQDVINGQDQSGARILVNKNSTPTTNQWLSSGQHTWSSTSIITGSSSFPINWGSVIFDPDTGFTVSYLDVYDLPSEPLYNQSVSGPGIVSGTTVLTTNYVNTQDNGLYHYTVVLSEPTISDQSLANVTLTFTDGDPKAALDGLELHFLPDDGTFYNPGNSSNNLNLYTSYVEVKLTETLSRVGTPIATIV
jgi:hypothetical protein